MSAKKDLKTYKQKRDFAKTPEPKGVGKKKLLSKIPQFVIQKHDATRLHYDFRIEMNGVLKSWAIPKGPSLDPKDKRLAIETEDHPLEYGSFEGVIPEGEYGAGPVIVWDRGHFANIKIGKDGNKVESLEACYHKGHIRLWLEGQKIKGGYDLIRTGDSNHWLLVKEQDEEADPSRNPVVTEPQSVITGKTIEEMMEDGRDEE